MNNFSLIGKFYNYVSLDKNHVKLILQSTSPCHKNIFVPIITSNENSIYKIKKGDLIGVKGFIDGDVNHTLLISSNITWLSQKK